MISKKIVCHEFDNIKVVKQIRNVRIFATYERNKKFLYYCPY